MTGHTAPQRHSTSGSWNPCECALSAGGWRSPLGEGIRVPVVKRPSPPWRPLWVGIAPVGQGRRNYAAAQSRLAAYGARSCKQQAWCETMIQNHKTTLLQEHVHYGSREHVKANTFRCHSRQPSPEPCRGPAPYDRKHWGSTFLPVPHTLPSYWALGGTGRRHVGEGATADCESSACREASEEHCAARLAWVEGGAYLGLLKRVFFSITRRKQWRSS